MLIDYDATIDSLSIEFSNKKPVRELEWEESGLVFWIEIDNRNDPVTAEIQGLYEYLRNEIEGRNE